MKAFLIGCIVALASVLLAGSALAATKGPQASIDTGVVAGVEEPGLSVFKGVPYAAPPVGPLRWKAPQPAAHWTGLRDASAYGAACPQDGAHKEAWAQVGKQSEDCLFLNVWRPKAAGRSTR